MDKIKLLTVDTWLLIKNLVSDYQLKNPLEYQDLVNEFKLKIEFYDTPRFFKISSPIDYDICIALHGPRMNNLIICDTVYNLNEESVYGNYITYQCYSERELNVNFNQDGLHIGNWRNIIFVKDALTKLLGMRYSEDFREIYFKNPSKMNQKFPNITATVQDLITHLQTNFKPTDKICIWYEGGAYMNCEHIPKDELGKRFFKYVKEDKKQLKESKPEYYTDDKLKEEYEWVNDEDVVIN